jgi:hypothetical protein
MPTLSKSAYWNNDIEHVFYNQIKSNKPLIVNEDADIPLLKAQFT